MNSLLVFVCGSDADCYNKGICNIDNGTCLCQLGWDHQSDCTGTYWGFSVGRFDYKGA